MSNLSNFQKEYSRIDTSGRKLKSQQISNEAIRKISFGRSRVKLGYDDISVDNEIFGNAKIDGETLYNVPTKVFIKAGRGKSSTEEKS